MIANDKFQFVADAVNYLDALNMPVERGSCILRTVFRLSIGPNIDLRIYSVDEQMLIRMTAYRVPSGFGQATNSGRGFDIPYVAVGEKGCVTDRVARITSLLGPQMDAERCTIYGLDGFQLWSRVQLPNGAAKEILAANIEPAKQPRLFAYFEGLASVAWDAFTKGPLREELKFLRHCLPSPD